MWYEGKWRVCRQIKYGIIKNTNTRIQVTCYNSAQIFLTLLFLKGMETTQRILLADIYSYCQRNKLLAKEREEREQANESQTEEGGVSESDSIIQDVKEHAPVLESPLENEVAPGPPKLIQLENPPDITEELKVLTADFPGLSRFRVTAVSDEEQYPNQDSNSSEEDLVPLVDLSNSNCSSDLNDASMTADLRDSATGHATLVDLDDSSSSAGSMLKPSAAPLIPAPTQTDRQITGMLLNLKCVRNTSKL